MEEGRWVLVAIGWDVNPGVDQVKVKWEVRRVRGQEDFANARIAGIEYRIKPGSPVMKSSVRNAARPWREPDIGRIIERRRSLCQEEMELVRWEWER